MPRSRYILASLILGILAASLIYLGQRPEKPGDAASAASRPILRLGLIPERDIFQQRRAYRVLADYLETRLDCQVKLQTNNTYEGMLEDFRDHQVDAAFLGSLVAALTVDRFSAQVVLKSEVEGNLGGEGGTGGGGGAGAAGSLRGVGGLEEGSKGIGEGVSTYAGVIFVPENSPARSFADLSGKSLGAVPTTTAGAVFPVYLLGHQEQGPRIVWSGTHDDVIREVLAGRLDAGAVKDLRLDAYERAHPEVRFRRLAMSPRVPNNALVIRQDLPRDLANDLRQTLLDMNDDVKGGGPQVLEELGFRRFVRCGIEEYGPLYDMLDAIGPRWRLLQIAGAAPRRPATGPSPPASSFPTVTAPGGK